MSAPSQARPSRWPRLLRAPAGPTGAFGLLAVGIAGLTLCVVHPAARLIDNASASAPLGFYWLDRNAPLRRGDFVLAWAPPAARHLAAARGYLPFDVPLVKRIVALRGDHICADGDTIFVNGRAVTTRLTTDSKGRALPHWQGCQVLGHSAVFLLMASVPDSFDGRYFGPIQRHAVIGRLTPLWTW